MLSRCQIGISGVQVRLCGVRCCGCVLAAQAVGIGRTSCYGVELGRVVNDLRVVPFDQCIVGNDLCCIPVVLSVCELLAVDGLISILLGLVGCGVVALAL